MKRFVLLRQNISAEEARQLAFLIHQLIDAHPRYLGLWEWQSTSKTINGLRTKGPTILRNGDRDVLAYRDYLPNGRGDVYCHPQMRDWVNGGMHGDPPPPLPPLREDLVLIDHRSSTK